MAVSGWSSVSSRRLISSAFSYSGWACGVLPLGVEVARHVVVAAGGVGVVVGEQAAVDLQHLLVQWLGRGVLPLVVEGFRLLIHGSGRLVGDPILLGIGATRRNVLRRHSAFTVSKCFGPWTRVRKASSSSALAIASSQRSAFSAARWPCPAPPLAWRRRRSAFAIPVLGVALRFGDAVWAVVGEPGICDPRS